MTTDAWVAVRYGEGYFGPEGPGDDPASLISVERCGECDRPCDATAPVRGRVQVLGDDLFFVPDEPFDARTRYRGTAVGLDGSIDFHFCTGDAVDARPPRLGSGLRFDPVPTEDRCQVRGRGYRIGVYTPPADDDGPGGSVEYLLFLTRASGLEAPVLVDRVRSFSSGDVTMYLFLEEALAASAVCIRVGALDGVGNVSMAPTETCFDPVTRIAFQGCAASRSAGRGDVALVCAGAIVAAFRARWRRRARSG